MNFRDTFSHSKDNPKIKLTKTNQKPIRRLQTEANEHTFDFKYNNNQFNKSTYKLQQKKQKQSQKNKYLEVYSKVQQPKQLALNTSTNRKTFKINSNRPFILHKYLKTQPDDSAIINNNLGHQRKISQINSVMQQSNPKYEIDGVAGKGTFGTVYIGHIKGSGKKVAIKKVFQDKKYKNRELQMLKTLRHTNLLEMKDHYMTTQGDKQYLNVVMDYFPQNLYQNIKKSSMNPNLIKIYIYQILRGLMYMSFENVAHRDMKPHNVLVNSQSNKVVICDFGSAKQLVKGEPNLAYICSRCYRAPQLIFGATDYTSQIDIWSTGCILVQMINGQPPFLGDSQIDQLIQIIKIMGTPSKQQVFEMNHNYDIKQYAKFPLVKKTQWKNVLKTKDPLLIDLVNKLMQYSPKRRFTAEDAMKHEYFDELRNEDTFKLIHQKVICMPQLFDFTELQLQNIKNIELLVPKWQQTNHTSNLTTNGFKNLNKITSNLNISLKSNSGATNKLSTTGVLNKESKGPVGHGYTLSSGLGSRKTHLIKRTHANY